MIESKRKMSCHINNNDSNKQLTILNKSQVDDM